jgi:hypothetical protein
VESPATAGRNDRVQALSTSVRQWRNLKLPLPIVLLPVDYAHAMWTFCALHHEVAHTLDQDLGLLAELRAALPETVPAGDEPHWRRWSAEILADALGIVLGGVGLLRRTGIAEHVSYADQLDAIWTAAPRPPWQQPLAASADAVAALFLESKLAALQGHQLTELNANMAGDQANIEALANFLLTGKKRPDPAAASMRPRLVPAAAHVALWNATGVDEAALAALHQAALDYLDKVPSIGTLAVAPGQRDYLRQLAGEIDFMKLRARGN